MIIVGPYGAHCLIPHCMEKLPSEATFPCSGVSSGEFRVSSGVSSGGYYMSTYTQELSNGKILERERALAKI